MAKKSQFEKAAETALAEAKVAVKRAEAAARKVGKEARERASALAARVSKLAEDASESWAKSAKSPTEPAASAPPAKPAVETKAKGPSAAGTKAKQPPADDLESLTVQQLRIRAKDAGLHGYSSLSKANLVKAIRAAK